MTDVVISSIAVVLSNTVGVAIEFTVVLTITVVVDRNVWLVSFPRIIVSILFNIEVVFINCESINRQNIDENSMK
jgi:hypothetical protein